MQLQFSVVYTSIMHPLFGQFTPHTPHTWVQGPPIMRQSYRSWEQQGDNSILVFINLQRTHVAWRLDYTDDPQWEHFASATFGFTNRRTNENWWEILWRNSDIAYTSAIFILKPHVFFDRLEISGTSGNGWHPRYGCLRASLHTKPVPRTPTSARSTPAQTANHYWSCIHTNQIEQTFGAKQPKKFGHAISEQEKHARTSGPKRCHQKQVDLDRWTFDSLALLLACPILASLA